MKKLMIIANLVSLAASVAIAQQTPATAPAKVERVENIDAVVSRIENTDYAKINMQLRTGERVVFVDKSKQLEKMREQMSAREFQEFLEKNSGRMNVGGGWQPEMAELNPVNELIVELIKSLPKASCNPQGVATILDQNLAGSDISTEIDVTLMPAEVKECLN